MWWALFFACSAPTPAPVPPEVVTPSAEVPASAPPSEPAPAAPEVVAPSPGACRTAAAVSDPDPNGLNVRAKPKGDILGTLPTETEVRVVESRDGWVRVTGAWFAGDDTREDWPEGWVHGSMLTTWLKTPEDYGPDAKPFLRDAPSAEAEREPISWEPPPTIKVLGCDGDFLHVELGFGDGTSSRGWLGDDTHCASTVTNCS
ncbi:MAG: SH3 domain-containing protein [Deltaproteobacteria bacterium]|nr:MAG: SH3 domain-containing protein [Deltaproteobacteria bacterium]